MTTKLKKPQEVQQLDSSAYTLRLKTDLAALAQLPPEEGPVPFLVHLDFAFANEPQILFVAGINNEWRKFAKAASWLKGPLLKQTWLGTCRLEGEVMQLVVRKGKILEKQFLAAIKHNSALKKLTWQIVEEPTEGEELEEEQEDSGPQQPTTNEDHRKQAQEINVQLVKLLPQIKDSVGPARQALLQEIEAWANRLYAIPNWEAYTDDKIERYLQQVEAFLAKQEQEQGSDPAALAGQYTKDTLTYLNAHPTYLEYWALLPNAQPAERKNKKLYLAVDSVKTSQVSKHIEGEVPGHGRAVGGHFAGKLKYHANGTHLGYVKNTSDKLRFKPAWVTSPANYHTTAPFPYNPRPTDPMTIDAPAVRDTNEIEMNNSGVWVAKTNIHGLKIGSSIFPNNWTLTQVEAETALACFKINANPGTAHVNANTYRVMDSAGTTRLQLFIGDSTDPHPFVSKPNVDLDIKSCFPS